MLYPDLFSFVSICDDIVCLRFICWPTSFYWDRKKSHYMKIIGINIFYARLIWKGLNSWNNKYKGILIQILHYQVFKLTSHDRELVIQNQYLKEKPEVVYNNLH